MISQFETLAITQAQKLINGALELDPGSTRSLQALADKRVLIVSTLPSRSLCLAIMPSGEVSLFANPDEPADVTLTGNPVSLATLFAQSAQRSSFANTGVTIEGDQELLQSLSTILGELEIDWEEILARLIGDVPAHLAGQAVRRGMKWQKSAAQRSASGLGEFFREESAMTLSNAEAEIWFQGVRLLSQDTERLAARIARLQMKVEAASN